jgi:signal transduction histidine kinase/ligand-binding sensor domain-containing protein
LRFFGRGEQNRLMLRRNARRIFFCRIFTAFFLWPGGIWLGLAAAPNYFTRTWQVENGLPQNKVTAVTQTHDGYLWLGTYGGLARFDGVQFKVFDDNNTPALHGSRVTSLFEAADGTLWIGDESGRVTQYKNGRFEAVEFHPDWSGGKIYDIASDETGDIWVLNESGLLARVRDGLVLTPETGTASKLVDMARSANGTIWVARDGRVSVLEKGHLRPLELNGAGVQNTYVMGIGASRDGGLWMAVDGRIRKWKDEKWLEDLGPTPWEPSPVTRWVETRQGVLFAGTADRGLYLFFLNQNEKPLHFDHAGGFPSDWVISLWEDREGNVWSGTGTGLVLVRPNNVETISPPDQWKGRAVLSVCPGQNGALWIGTEGAGVYRFQNGVWKNFNTAEGIHNPYVWSLAEDPQGRLWVGTWGGGLFVQKDELFDFAPGMTNLTPPMPAILFAHNGLWIGTTAGLLRYENDKATWFNKKNGQTFGDVRTIAESNEGELWFGMAGNGLARLENQDVRLFKKSDGVSSDFIECLHFSDDGTLWIGTFGGGLNRYKDGHFSVINRNAGLPNNAIGDIEADGRGYFWISSYGGIIRVSEAELNRCADGEIKEMNCLTFGMNDGLPTLECSEGLQPAGCKTPDGHLWFPTSKGLVSIDPANVRFNRLPPPVVIEEMRVDDQPFAIEALGDAPFKIPPGRHRFDFQYTGLSFIAPEKVRFKYRLNGFDNDWVDAGTKRLAIYNSLAPGEYSFQVTACNNDGVWSETGASVAFRVLPFFWQTSWFRVLVLAALVAASGGLVWIDTRRRMRRKLERIERQRDIEHERARIAQDIHDDLGANLTRITMLSESARSELGSSTQTLNELNQIYDTARELTHSMDEIVWAVNPKHDTLESLTGYLEKFAQDLLATAGIRCRLDMPDQFPEWRLTAEIRHNVFLAFKEALHNVVRHASAAEVSIFLKLDKLAFELTVADDGRGFSREFGGTKVADTSDRISSGDGLENMNRRLHEIGGVCEIQTGLGQGTKVHFIVPLKVVEA